MGLHQNTKWTQSTLWACSHRPAWVYISIASLIWSLFTNRRSATCSSAKQDNPCKISKRNVKSSRSNVIYEIPQTLVQRHSAGLSSHNILQQSCLPVAPEYVMLSSTGVLRSPPLWPWWIDFNGRRVKEMKNKAEMSDSNFKTYFDSNPGERRYNNLYIYKCLLP